MSSRSRLDKARATELSIQAGLREYTQHIALPFAITVGGAHRLVYANPAFCRLAGIVSGDALNAPIGTFFTASESVALNKILDRAFRDRVELLDAQIDESREKGSGWRYSIWPVIAPDGSAEALGIEIRERATPDTALDLQRQVAEQMLLGALRERGFAEDAEAARRRAAFLAEAGRLLAESVDQSSTLIALTKLALPLLDAWCIVDILEEGDSIHRLGIYHPDPAKQDLARKLQKSWGPEPADQFGAPAMVRDPRTILITDDIEATLAAAAHTPENLHLLGQLGIGSLLTTPLVARKKLLGAITFVGSQRDVPYSPDDVHLAEDVATRGALALDSAQVYDLALMHKRSAETANKAKTAFLGAMSHELRTPLNAIAGYVELLELGIRGPVTAEQIDDLQRIKQAQRHLTGLIGHVLNYVRVETGRVDYDLKSIAVNNHLLAIEGLIAPQVAAKRLAYSYEPCEPSPIVLADPEKLDQILLNLLTNAIKFTDAGRVWLDCELRGFDVLIRVHDTGAGIPPGRLDDIFEPFIQVNRGFAAGNEGVGLGLAISRDLARGMGGGLTVESELGTGSTFTLTLRRGDEH